MSECEEGSKKRKRKKRTTPEYQRARTAKKIADGICVRCTEPAREGLRLCSNHSFYEAVRQRAKVNKGLCIWCKAPAAKNRSSCQFHLEERRKYRKKRLAGGLCLDCNNPPEEGKSRCVPCRDAARIKSRLHRQVCKEQGICNECYKPVMEGKTLCLQCFTYYAYQRLKLRKEVLNAYGGCKCVCCGEIRPEFLTINHTNNDGYLHRKKIGKPFYQILKKQGFPKDVEMRVMCYNCNMSRQTGMCIHEIERQSRSSIVSKRISRINIEDLEIKETITLFNS